MSSMDLQDIFFLYRTDALEEAELAEAESLLAAEDPAALKALAEADSLLGQVADLLEPVTPPAEIGEALIARAEASIAPPVSLSSVATARRWGGSLALAAGLGLIVSSSIAWVQRETGFKQELAQLETAAAKERGRAEAMSAQIAALEVRVQDSERELAVAENARSLALEESQSLSRKLEVLEGAPREPIRIADSAGRDSEGLRERIAVLESELEGKVAQRAELDAQAAQQRAQWTASLARSRAALSMVRAPDVGIVDLVSADVDSPSSASVFWDPALKNCYMHVQGLPQIEQSERYALWLEYENGQMHRVSDFEVDDRGSAEFYEDLPGDKGGVLKTFVTRENSAGSIQPSGQVVLSELVLPSGSDQGTGSQSRRYRRRAL